MMHAFWKASDPVIVHTQLAMFMKNMSLLGAAFLIAYFGGGPMALGD
jgi:putative oxidoreductase